MSSKVVASVGRGVNLHWLIYDAVCLIHASSRRPCAELCLRMSVCRTVVAIFVTIILGNAHVTKPLYLKQLT